MDWKGGRVHHGGSRHEGPEQRDQIQRKIKTTLGKKNRNSAEWSWRVRTEGKAMQGKLGGEAGRQRLSEEEA